MIVTRVECETCHSSFPISHHQRPYEWNVPDKWMTLIPGNPQHNEGWHFCSYDCLMGWLKKTLGDKE